MKITGKIQETRGVFLTPANLHFRSSRDGVSRLSNSKGYWTPGFCVEVVREIGCKVIMAMMFCGIVYRHLEVFFEFIYGV